MVTDSTNPELLESIRTADEFLAKGGWDQNETDDDNDSGEAYAEPKPPLQMPKQPWFHAVQKGIVPNVYETTQDAD